MKTDMAVELPGSPLGGKVPFPSLQTVHRIVNGVFIPAMTVFLMAWLAPWDVFPVWTGIAAVVAMYGAVVYGLFSLWRCLMATPGAHIHASPMLRVSPRLFLLPFFMPVGNILWMGLVTYHLAELHLRYFEMVHLVPEPETRRVHIFLGVAIVFALALAWFAFFGTFHLLSIGMIALWVKNLLFEPEPWQEAYEPFLFSVILLCCPAFFASYCLVAAPFDPILIRPGSVFIYAIVAVGYVIRQIHALRKYPL